MSDTEIARWPAGAPGRSRTVAHAGLVWTVANTTDRDPDFAVQVRQSLDMLERHLHEAGSDRSRLLSLQLLLVDIGQREAFDALWRVWIGPDPAHWPQRAVMQAGLAPGLQIELVAVAAQAR